MEKLIKLPEPRLLFGFDQKIEDPRDGLTLFGPLDDGSPYGIRAGVIGTRSGIECFKRWVTWLQQPVFTPEPNIARPPFPGFAAAFRIPWHPKPFLEIEIDEDELKRRVLLDNKFQRVYGAVSLYVDPLIAAKRDEEKQPDMWFIVIPDFVKRYCRPQANVETALRITAPKSFGKVSLARRSGSEPFLFGELNDDAEPYFFKEHFRAQLKARLLEHIIPTQVVTEGVLSNVGKWGNEGVAKNDAIQQPAIAWHLGTAAFYKSGGRPWKVADIREGVCYIGLVFKQDARSGNPRYACCAAQMFLDSGDGLIFKRADGDWYWPDRKEFHLNREAARELIKLAIASYKKEQRDKKPADRKPPREIFIHGKVKFDYEEWRGFEEAAGTETNIVGIKIRDDASLKLYRKSDNPVLRGTAYVRDERSALLWTRGWTPRLRTYPGREVPNPLSIEVCQGQARIETVLTDIQALTKLNYNACVFGDGQPITLKFADAVGEVLTAGPIKDNPPLPFRYYI